MLFFVEKFSSDWIKHGSLGDSLNATFLKKLFHAGLPETFFLAGIIVLGTIFLLLISALALWKPASLRLTVVV